MSKKLAEILVELKVVAPELLTRVEKEIAAGHMKKGYVRTFLELNITNEILLLFTLSKKFDLPSINIAKFEIPAEVLRLIPKELARKTQVIPIQLNSEDGIVIVAICDPTCMTESVDAIKAHTNLKVEAVLTSFSAFDTVMAKVY